jgi:TonB family protein
LSVSDIFPAPSRLSSTSLGLMQRAFPILAVVLVCTPAIAQTPKPFGGVSYGQPKALAIYAPPPEYPIEARQRHLTGDGVIVVDVDHNTGYVTAARVLKSTGHRILDNAALRAFRLWRFKLGSFKPQIRLPIHYTMSTKT